MLRPECPECAASDMQDGKKDAADAPHVRGVALKCGLRHRWGGNHQHRAGYRTAHKGIEMKKLIALLALGCAVLAGCKTMAGMGKDIQTGGQKLENAADNTKQKM